MCKATRQPIDVTPYEDDWVSPSEYGVTPKKDKRSKPAITTSAELDGVCSLVIFIPLILFGVYSMTALVAFFSLFF